MPDYICEVCGQALSSASALTTHMRTHTGEQPYQCEVCSRRFAQATNLIQHMLTHTNSCPFSCPACGMPFSQLASARRHQQIAHDENTPFQCPQCSCRFTLEAYLTRHRRQAHPSGSTTQSVAVHTHPQHMRTHTNPRRPYSCPKCGMSFVRLPKKHQKTAHDDNRIWCPECGYRFRQKSNLATHRRQVRPFESATQSVAVHTHPEPVGMVTQHMPTHTGARPYSCPVCGLAFAQSGDLKLHQERFHDENRPFPCPLCSYRFNRESDLSRHRRKAHQSGLATQSVAVHTHTESVGMVTVTTQTNVSSGNTTTISTVTSPIGSAYVFTTYNPSATTTTTTQGSGLVTTNTDPNFPGSDSGNIEEIPDSELASSHPKT